jgi:signal transduction histidine kinase
MKLLIVDDHPINRKLLMAQLGATGHAVFEASDGMAALAQMEREIIEVVISDILMPRMDGYWLCHEIRASEHLQHLPVIIYTSIYNSPNDEKLALNVGADKYLRKPATIETMLAALHEVSELPRRRHQAPPRLPEAELMKEYSQRLVNRLEEKNVELERAKTAAEKANLAKSDFLSRMSHDLRSPLHAILGFAQLLQSGSPTPTASQAKSITQILQAGWYLLELINDILDLAVIESGKLSLSMESVSLSELLAECKNIMEPMAQQLGILMTFPCFENSLLVSADRIRLKQIVINLVSNAIKYNKKQGAVVVDCTVMDPQRTRISVRDTGAGLPAEKLSQLFVPFNRLGQESGQVAGTGIGLVVSRQLAEMMGGRIGVRSSVGVGSEFWCEVLSNEVSCPPGDATGSNKNKEPIDTLHESFLRTETRPAGRI